MWAYRNMTRTDRNMTRTEVCACGGTLRADPSVERSVLSAIRSHNRSARHLAWRAWRES